jgi:hypothetical protein
MSLYYMAVSCYIDVAWYPSDGVQGGAVRPGAVALKSKVYTV